MQNKTEQAPVTGTQHDAEICGNWESALTAELIVSDNISITEPIQHDETTYFIERRPQEAGRCVIVKHVDGDFTDCLPMPYSARSRVHEYGGGSYCIDTISDTQTRIYFVNDSDQDIYVLQADRIERITTEPTLRFADFSFDSHNNRLITVCERHADDANVSNFIAGITLDNGPGRGKVTPLVQGDDFYASPRLNPSLDTLCWQSWNHPEMPWDGNELWLARIKANGSLGDKQHIAGDRDTSVFQPRWSPDNSLYFISDDTGWWHIYRCVLQQGEAERSEPKPDASPTIQQITTGQKEFGSPQWVFAQSNYVFIDQATIICCYQADNRATLASIDLMAQNRLTIMESDWQDFSYLASDGRHLCFIAASSRIFPTLISTRLSTDLFSPPSYKQLRASSELLIPDGYLSQAVSLSFDNRHQQKVYANYYPPTNPQYKNDTRPPPLIVICHGGPTGQSSTALDPRKLYWTSRGFALLDVNYSGSTGYGRDYRLRLNKKWGQLDVEDCCDAALYAVAQGLADRDKLIIRGSSAGGYTVLAALTFNDVFSAGASYYGISELSSLATDTHKFEARYLDRLVGAYPEEAELYRQRSPINHTDRLNCPVIFFQGLEDRVVPKRQAEMMFEALQKKGLTVAAQYFSGEQHGFRKAETIVLTLENELRFYQLVLQLRTKQEIGFSGDIQLENV